MGFVGNYIDFMKVIKIKYQLARCYFSYCYYFVPKYDGQIFESLRAIRLMKNLHIYDYSFKRRSFTSVDFIT